MSNLIAIEDLEIVSGKKLSNQSTYLKAGINRLRNKGKVLEQDNEQVVDPFELMIEVWKIARANDKRCGSNNNPTGA
jgi:hypothetical protein